MLVPWRASNLDLAVNSFHLGVMGCIQSLFVFSPTLRGETGADVRHMVVHLGKLSERGFLLGIFM